MSVQVTTSGLVLKAVKYGDTSLVVTVFTRQYGVQSYMVKGARTATKKRSGKALYFQPGSFLELTIYEQPGKQLQFVKEVQWLHILPNIQLDITKNAVCVFMVECTYKCLHDSSLPQLDLFAILEKIWLVLEQADKPLTAILPLYFLVCICKNLGFQILGEYTAQTTIIDFALGRFVATTPLHPHYVSEQCAEVIHTLQRVENMSDLLQIRLPHAQRNYTLDQYLYFLQLHVSGFTALQSLPIVRTVLS